MVMRGAVTMRMSGGMMRILAMMMVRLTMTRLTMRGMRVVIVMRHRNEMNCPLLQWKFIGTPPSRTGETCIPGL